MAQRSSRDDGVQFITQEIDTEQGLTTPTTLIQGTARLCRKCDHVSGRNVLDYTHIPYTLNISSLTHAILWTYHRHRHFPFRFSIGKRDGSHKGNEDRTGYYAEIIVRSFLFPLGLSIHCRTVYLDRSRRPFLSRLSSSCNGGDHQRRSAVYQSY